MSEILLVRHAQSAANVAGVWQGRGDGRLSPAGREQINKLGDRLADAHFDVVATSPLTRAVETATAIGAGVPQLEDDLIEVDLGDWEGVGFGEVLSSHGTLLRSIFRGSDEAFGETGERISQVAERVWPVLEGLADQVGPDGRAAVVTHGGVIDAVISTVLPSVTRRPHRIVSNTALTHLVRVADGWRLSRFNDSTHLHRLPEFANAHLEKGGSVLALIRHGRTQANVERRFQGQSCWGLDEEGVRQSAMLAEWYGPINRVYSSPLDRAAATAAALSDDVIPVDGLMEIGMGHWEGLASTEVHEGWPDLVRRIYQDGEDLPRGETGETWRAVTERVVATVDSLETSPGEVTAVVAHGGVIRAYIATLGGGDDGAKPVSLHTPENTSVTHIALTEDGPVMCDYAVAPHLDGRAVNRV